MKLLREDMYAGETSTSEQTDTHTHTRARMPLASRRAPTKNVEGKSVERADNLCRAHHLSPDEMLKDIKLFVQDFCVSALMGRMELPS